MRRRVIVVRALAPADDRASFHLGGVNAEVLEGVAVARVRARAGRVPVVVGVSLLPRVLRHDVLPVHSRRLLSLAFTSELGGFGSLDAGGFRGASGLRRSIRIGFRRRLRSLVELMPGARVPGAVFRDVDDGELRAGCAGERGGGPHATLVPPWKSFGGQVEAEPIE